MIDLKQINKVYPGGYQALTDVNLTVNAGGIFGIIGPSGAGKSSLLRIINLLEHPTSGSVWMDGVEISPFNRRSLQALRRKIGLIFQSFNLLSSQTVSDNIALPLRLQGEEREVIENKVRELIHWVGLENHQYAYPDTLSGGQKQRVAIARALITDPDIVLCDEITASLDQASTRQILHILKNINEKLGKTIVLITHEIDVIKSICDRVGVIDKGRLVEVNDTVSLFVNPVHDATKNLIEDDWSIKFSDLDASQTHLLFKLTDDDCHRSLISQLIKTFDLSVNILQADIFKIKKSRLGYVLCGIDGCVKNIEACLSYIEANHLNVEVIHHV